MASLGVKLVILDSVASLVRKEFDGRSIRKRTELLTAEASILKCARAALPGKPVIALIPTPCTGTLPNCLRFQCSSPTK